MARCSEPAGARGCNRRGDLRSAPQGTAPILCSHNLRGLRLKARRKRISHKGAQGADHPKLQLPSPGGSADSFRTLWATGLIGQEKADGLQGILNGQKGLGCGRTPRSARARPTKGTHAPFPPLGWAPERRWCLTDLGGLQACRSPSSQLHGDHPNLRASWQARGEGSAQELKAVIFQGVEKERSQRVSRTCRFKKATGLSRG